jgi:hypothetical protein
MKPTVSFGIEDVARGPNGAAPFGAAFAGTFVCRVPSLEEARATLPLRVTGRAQRDGASDAAGVMLPTYMYVTARVWLDGLSVSVPPWYEAVQKDEAEDDEYTFEAVLVSYRTLTEQLAARKKKPPEVSATPSPDTSPNTATNS